MHGSFQHYLANNSPCFLWHDATLRQGIVLAIIENAGEPSRVKLS